MDFQESVYEHVTRDHHPTIARHKYSNCGCVTVSLGYNASATKGILAKDPQMCDRCSTNM